MFTGLIQESAEAVKLERQSSSARLRVRSFKLRPEDLNLGDSIAVNGCCLSVVEFGEFAATPAAAPGAEEAGLLNAALRPGSGSSSACTASSPPMGTFIDFELSSETLERTNLGRLAVPSGAAQAPAQKDLEPPPAERPRVHLEPALRMGSALGGHLLSGHVDGVGRVLLTQAQDGYLLVKFELRGPARDAVAPFLVEKGSVGVDGVSLTVNQVWDEKDSTTFSVMLIPHTLSLTTFARLAPGLEVNLEADLMAKYINRYRDYQAQKQNV